jgi:hypothetical protein
MLNLLSAVAIAWVAIIVLVLGLCRASASADLAVPRDPVTGGL